MQFMQPATEQLKQMFKPSANMAIIKAKQFITLPLELILKSAQTPLLCEDPFCLAPPLQQVTLTVYFSGGFYVFIALI